jgi:hypothetical protein
MEFILPPTEEPFGPSCAGCELFTRGECLGVSTVRVVVGTAQKIEESNQFGTEVDLSPLRDPAVGRSFRILQKALRYCPGPGNDGRGDFRPSNDRLSGYVSASIIKTALAVVLPQAKNTATKKLFSSGHSFIPDKTSQEDGSFDQRA